MIKIAQIIKKPSRFCDYFQGLSLCPLCGALAQQFPPHSQQNPSAGAPLLIIPAHPLCSTAPPRANPRVCWALHTSITALKNNTKPLLRWLFQGSRSLHSLGVIIASFGGNAASLLPQVPTLVIWNFLRCPPAQSPPCGTQSAVGG